MTNQSFVQAHAFENANRGVGDIDRIVVHTAEIQEHRDSAEDVAAFFAKKTTGVSAHKCIDNNSIVTCVRDEDVAFHAFGDNLATIGYELSGFASQTREQWRDDYSLAVVENAAAAAALACEKYAIPVRWLTLTQLKRREKGFVTHKLVSDAFGQGIRSDPGENFPYKRFLERVEALMRPEPQQWRWVIFDGKGAELARSAKMTVQTERERLKNFRCSDKVGSALLSAGRHGKAPVWRRVKA